MHLSVVVPFLNEEENVLRVHEAISDALSEFDHSYEMVFVDDGSTDRTFEILTDISKGDTVVRVIRFRRNYGQTAAMSAGIQHASGDVIVTMDGDLQNDPKDIPRLVDKIHTGYDLAVGWRHNRQDKLVTRKIPSVIANWLIGMITQVPIKDNGCSLKAYRSSIIKNIPLYSEMHRFIPAMASISGARIVELKVRHHPRRFGSSKYGLSRIYKVLLDLLTIKTIISFASRPLLWFTILALPPGIFAFATIGHASYQLAIHGEPYSLPVVGTAVLFAALSIIVFFVGALAELAYKTGNVRLENFALLTARKIVFDSVSRQKILS